MSFQMICKQIADIQQPETGVITIHDHPSALIKLEILAA